jgi:hypothetical protein
MKKETKLDLGINSIFNKLFKHHFDLINFESNINGLFIHNQSKLFDYSNIDQEKNNIKNAINNKILIKKFIFILNFFYFLIIKTLI